MTLLQSHWHLYCGGSWSQYSSKPCLSTDRWPQCVPLEVKVGLDFVWLVDSSHHFECTRLRYSHVASCTRDLYVMSSSCNMTPMSHTKFFDKIRNLLVLLNTLKTESRVRSILKNETTDNNLLLNENITSRQEKKLNKLLFRWHKFWRLNYWYVRQPLIGEDKLIRSRVE